MFFGNKTPVIDENNIVEEWSQLVLGLGGRGEELLKSIARKIQELNLPSVALLRKEATLGQSRNAYQFVSMKHQTYPDYELWIGAIDRAGQLKASWFLTVAIPGRIVGTLRAIDRAEEALPGPIKALNMLPKMLGRLVVRKAVEQIRGTPAVVRVRPENMTLDDKEEFGTYITLVHQAVLGGLQEMMNDLNLDFSKVDKHSKGFLNLS